MKVALRDSPLDLTVLVPCLDGEPPDALAPALCGAFDSAGVEGEVLLLGRWDAAGGGMSDGRIRRVAVADPAYGAAFLQGLGEARGAFVLTLERDHEDPGALVRQLWDARHGVDLVVASRYVRGGHARVPLVRHVLSSALNAVFRQGLALPVHDITSSCRLYRKTLFRDMDVHLASYVVLAEVLMRAVGRGARLREVPFTYHPARAGSSWGRLAAFGFDYARLFREVWRIRNSVEFPDYDWRAHDSRIPLQRYWQRRRHRLVLGFTPAGARTLDVGCGSSRILADLPGAVGLDMRHDKLAFMRRTNRLLVQGDGLRLPFADGEFGCVVCSQVIEHIPAEGGRLLDELTRVLAPGGTLVIGTPDYGSWQWPAIEWVYGKVAPGAYADEHVTHYTRDSLCRALEERGYADLRLGWICRAELIVRATKGPSSVLSG